MHVKEKSAQDWTDGFLFVGNHLALDLVNTHLVNPDDHVELLPDTASLWRWLVAAGVLNRPREIAAVRGWNDSPASQAFLRDLLLFREALRAAALRFGSGKVPDHFLGELNQKLLAYPRRHILKPVAGSIERKIYLELKKPQELWSEIAFAASDLLTNIPHSRVRKCDGCIVTFYDTSKKSSRRWCSMHMCGNREKVAAYRSRQPIPKAE